MVTTIWTNGAYCYVSGDEGLLDMLFYGIITKQPFFSTRYGRFEREVKLGEFVFLQQGIDENDGIDARRAGSGEKGIRFPIGLYDDVVRKLAVVKVPVIQEDLEKFISVPVFVLPYVSYRDYQLDALQSILVHSRGMIEMPTGSGKTVVILGLIWSLIQEKVIDKGLILVYSQESYKQMNAFIKQFIGDCDKILVKKVMTVKKQIEKSEEELNTLLKTVGCVIVDECHRSKAHSWHKILKECNAKYRFGFSATITENNNYEAVMMKMWLGDVILRKGYDVLSEQGYLAKVKVYIVNNKVAIGNIGQKLWTDIHGDNYKGEPFPEFYSALYREVYKKVIVEGVERNNLIASIAAEACSVGLQCIVMVDEIRQGQFIRDVIEKLGIKESVFVFGESGDRKGIIEKLINKEVLALVATEWFKEAIDIPDLNCIIVGGGEKSQVKILQEVGRGTRFGKTGKLFVVDFLDEGSSYLTRHSKKRKALYEEQGWKVENVEQLESKYFLNF